MTQTNPMQELARAKVNLALHITGRRGDGYHLLDSLVVFPDFGDVLRYSHSDAPLSLQIDGPFGAGLSSRENLVLTAAQLIAPRATGTIALRKNLPVASGIGGGSADAAAMLRLGARLWGGHVDAADVLVLGADVPVCLASETVRMRGVGDVITPVGGLPDVHIVLINPGYPLATAAVFAGLMQRENPQMSAPDPRDFRGWLAAQRNDMQAAATALCPAIADCLAALRAQDAWLARMSGSGATCFGLFDTASQAAEAAAIMAQAQPGWWVQAGRVRRN